MSSVPGGTERPRWHGPEPDLERLREVAEAANDGDRAWTWKGGYPQNVLRMGDVVLVADCFAEPDHPADFAEHIATFDPPTVLNLLNLVEFYKQMAGAA